jgi:hypothetical protein
MQVQELRAYGICQSCFEPYPSHRGCLRCERGADARVPMAEGATVLPVDIEMERQAELHRVMPKAFFAVVGATVVVVALIAVAIQAA